MRLKLILTGLPLVSHYKPTIQQANVVVFRRKTLPLFLLLVLITACTPGSPTLTPTRILSAPPLALSPTPRILTSDELYDDNTNTFGQTDLTLAALPNNADRLPPIFTGVFTNDGAEIVQIVNADGSMYQANLYTTGSRIRVPGILLLADATQDWGTFPGALVNAGFVVLAVQIDDNTSTTQMDTVLQSLGEIGGVDPAQLAIVGALGGADLGMDSCLLDDLCDGVALLSPLQQRTSPPSISQKPLLLVVSTNDTESFPIALGIVQLANNAEIFSAEAGRGTSFVTIQGDLQTRIIAWLVQTLELSGS